MGTFAIGDIHGQSGALQALMNLQLFSKKDTLVFLGDYVDRGPDVKGVIDLLLEISNRYKTVFLKGNHDIMMVNARTNQQHLSSWLVSGGTQTLGAYQIGEEPDWPQKIPASHWAFLKNGKPYFEQNDIIFVHAGLEAGVPLNQQDDHHLYWKKYKKPGRYHSDKTVICGHTSRKNGKIADFGHTICIDTYAYGGEWLTCFNVQSRQFWQSKENGAIRSDRLN